MPFLKTLKKAISENLKLMALVLAILTFCILGFFINCSMTPNNLVTPSGILPNLREDIKKLAESHQQEFSTACSDWRFIDIVVAHLRQSQIWRYGYNCDLGDCGFVSPSQVAFYTGQGTPQEANQSTDSFPVNVVSCISSGPQVLWQVKINVPSRWKQDKSPQTTTPIEQSCPIPNKLSVIERVADRHQQALTDTDCANDYQEANYEFIDQVLEALRLNDRRFGYHCLQGDCRNLSYNEVAFYCGSSTPDSDSIKVGVVEVINPEDCEPDWLEQTQDILDAGYVTRWKYPRPGLTLGKDPDSTTTTTTTTTQGQLGQCDVPNRLSVASKVARDHPDLLAKSNNKAAKNWEFLEKLIEELRKENSRWGFYHRTQHNLQEASLDAIAYYCGEGDGNESSDLRFVDVISSSLDVYWGDTGHEDRAKPENGYWKYPRTGTAPPSEDSDEDNDMSDFAWNKVTFLRGTNVSGWRETSHIREVSVSQRGICIDHPKNGQWTGKVAINPKPGERALLLEGNHWIIVKKNERYYAATYDWIRDEGQKCKLVTGDLARIYEELGKGQIRVAPLNKNWKPKGGDVVGFMASGLARSQVRNEKERSNIQWYRLPSVDGQISGQMLGTFTGSENSFTPPSNTLPPTDNSSCQEVTKNLPYGQAQRGSACQNSQDYNILTFDMDGAVVCCQRTPKDGTCPSRYKKKDGNCFPDCGTAARLAGYTGVNHILTRKKKYPVDQRSFLRGGDKEEFISTCAGLNKIEQSDCGRDNVKGLRCRTGWKDFSFWDPYRFVISGSKSDIHDVTNENMCCVAGEPKDPVQLPCHAQEHKDASYCQ